MRSPHAHWALLGAALVISVAAAQSNDGTPTGSAPVSPLRAAPAETTAAAVADPHWQVPRTSWGQPSFEGVWSTDDLRSVPLNRPASFGTRATLDEAEFRERAARDEEGRAGPGSFLQWEWGVRTFGYTSLVIDPPNGQIPKLTPAGEALAATRVRGTFGPGPFDSLEDFTLYDRCITRGALGSLLPVIYGNGLRITQSPDAIAITYEMIHDTRVVPLDGRAALEDDMRQWMGSARGRWDGDTLVVESAGFTDRTSLGVNGGGSPNSEALRLTERFTRVDPDMIEYVATVVDPVAYTAPYTLRLMITKRPGYEMLEYSCHEGNGAVRNALSGERVYEKQVAEARAKGLPPPARATEHEQIRNGVPDPSAVIDINAGE
ncbi:MAG TPA: hypothetical protein VIC71_07645 [Gammaproteobacteria bacterium]|jgi:hypothetical protein